VSSQRTRHLPTLDPLESRLVLSPATPANTLAIRQGIVPNPGAIAEVQVPVTTGNLNGRRPLVIGTSTMPTAGSTLLPRVVFARGPNGHRQTIRQGAPFNPKTQLGATTYIQTSTPGTLNLGVTGLHQTTGTFQLRSFLPGDLTGDGQVTLADLHAFPKSYLTRSGDANFAPAADANLNNQIGQQDARNLIRNLKPLTPKIPLKVDLTLAPEDAVRGHVPSTSGGHTYHETVTILGRTTPGSIVLADGGLGNYSFEGPAIATDAQGNFSVKAKNVDGINNNNFLVIDPYGQQVVRDFPIYYFPAVYSREHPTTKVKVGVPGTQPNVPGPGTGVQPPGVVLPPGIP
jgi:hypothetical protein